MSLTPTWPPTWSGSNFKKSPTDRKLEQRDDRRAEIAHEEAEKRKVRKREKFACRFPLCGCRKLKLRLEVSHDKHKGAGGNPSGDRSIAKLMVLLCVHRHQDGAVSRHKGTLKTKYLTRSAGYNGPVAWLVDLNAIGRPVRRERFKEVARESAPGVLEPLTPWQEEVLALLASMTC